MTLARGPIIIIGGGASAHSCADAYRQAGGQDDLVIVSADDRPPYYRPPLTKEYLRGEIDAGELPLADDGWYDTNAVELRLGSVVQGIDLEQHQLVIGNDRAAWSRLVVATGSMARAVPAPGGDHPELLTIRAAADAEHVMGAVAEGDEVVIIGAGFVGCEAAASLRARGLNVTVVTPEPGPQHERLGADVGRIIAGWLGDDGVAAQFGQGVASIERRSDGWRVHLDDATVLRAGHVLAATGAVPNIDLAERAGLPIDGGGIVTDASMLTPVPGVYAVGDVAFAHNHGANRRLRVEHWQDAVDMGRLAGQGLAGRETGWHGVPGFWSTIGSRTLKLAAWGDGWTDVMVDGDGDGFTAWYGREGTIVGVLTHERDGDYERGAKLVATAAPFPPG